MKERPILFQTEMVRGILNDWKFMTRRLKGLELINEHPDDWRLSSEVSIDKKGRLCVLFQKQKGRGIRSEKIACPYGNIGDILWVRENLFQNGELGLEYIAGKETIDEAIIPESYGPYGGSYSFRTIPNIHMPKWAARIWLKITGIRVERLQDISEEDAKHEGVDRWTETRMKSKPTHYKIYCDPENPNDPAMYSSMAKYSFETLWYSINGLESWASNPSVWVISFEIISTTGKSF